MKSVVKCGQCEWLVLRWQNLLNLGWVYQDGWLCPVHKEGLDG